MAAAVLVPATAGLLLVVAAVVGYAAVRLGLRIGGNEAVTVMSASIAAMLRAVAVALAVLARRVLHWGITPFLGAIWASGLGLLAGTVLYTVDASGPLTRIAHADDHTTTQPDASTERTS